MARASRRACSSGASSATTRASTGRAAACPRAHSPTRIARISARPQRSGWTTSACPSRATPRTWTKRASSCAMRAAMGCWWRRSNARRRSRIWQVVRASDGVMVARGDLGVEMGYAELAGLQKQIIQETRHQNRVVIMATQMMESMITNTIPTRAEVSDVANAVMDGTDAVMLSAETASGRHPKKVVEAMAQIIVGAEKYQVQHVRVRQRKSGYYEHTDEAVASAVMYTANHLHVKAIVALTESGSTSLWMSRVRSDIPIYAFTRHQATRCRVALYRGVYPVAYDVTDKGEAFYFSIFRLLLDLELVEEGDSVILTKGELSGVSGGTNSMQILRVTRSQP